jgi:CRP-like cAMP-binding protein
MSPHSLQEAESGPGTDFLNRLLSSLGQSGRTRFSRQMQRMQLTSQEVLYRPDQRISEIYFPETCVIAMLTVMRNGATIESATVGREGASWISASFHSPTMPCQTMVAIPGFAYKVPTQVVEHEIRENGDFHDILSHYSHSLLIQTLRSTACNGLHTMEQRCSRWMLMTLDRTDISQFVITHDFLASLLGVQRPGISLLVERLASQGVVEIGRGEIRVADRNKLERLSCECYAIMKEQFTKSWDRN